MRANRVQLARIENEMQAAQLSAKDQHTLEQIYQHPATHNLEWHHVIALFSHIGTVEEMENGHVTLTLNGESKVFPRGLHKDVSDVDQVVDIRNFLNKAKLA